MYEPKEDLYTILNSIAGVTVYQTRPEVLQNFPCITFNIGSNIPEYDLSKEITHQDIDAVIDIYAETSKETGSLLASLQQKMIDNDYRMVFCMDIPDDNASHITTRFNLVD